MKVGVLGAGQLALMLAQEAEGDSVQVVPFGSQRNVLLERYSTPVYGDINNADELKAFVDSVDVVTYETENIPFDALDVVEDKSCFVPSMDALKIFQHRFHEKSLFVDLGIPTVNFAPVSKDEDLETAAEAIGFPAIIKTCTEGYDGKSQYRVKSYDELVEGWAALEKRHCIVEAMLDFDHEISIIAVRSADQNIVYYPVSENYHKDGILRLSVVTGQHQLQDLAESIVSKVMDKLDYIGCLAFEFFVKDGQLYANEIAPRVHNSGHWSLDGADSSQFYLHTQAVAGRTVETPKVDFPSAMVNLIGNIPNLDAYKDSETISVYDYGKEARPGRKLGHVNLVGRDMDLAQFSAFIADFLDDVDLSMVKEGLETSTLSAV